LRDRNQSAPRGAYREACAAAPPYLLIYDHI